MKQEMNREKTVSRGILALHGFTGAGADFDFLKSKSPAHFLWEAPNLPAVPLDSLCEKLRERWARLSAFPRTLLGYSMGGRIALHLAKRIPWNEADELVLVSASPGIAEERERAARRDADEALAREMEQFASAEKFYEKWQRVPLISTQRRLPSPWREQLLARRAAADWRVWASHLRLWGTGTLPSLWDGISALAVPNIRVIVGEEDLKFRAIAEKMCEKIPRSRMIVIPSSGHSPHFENAESFVKAAF